MDSKFTLDNYRALLELALNQGWKFVGFPDLCIPSTDRKIALRHDIDFSIEMAYEISLVNKSLQVCGSFLFLLQSDMYNLYSSRNLDRVLSIHEAGQIVGLHIPCSMDARLDENQTRDWVNEEFVKLRQIFPFAQPVFAWHNSTPDWLARFKNLEVSGLLNAYDDRFTRDCLYRSDSNLRNSVSDFAQILCDTNITRLQWLVHPLYWVAGGNNMIEILANTWKRILLERDAELSTNSTYARLMPNGMGDDIIQLFTQTWINQAQKSA